MTDEDIRFFECCDDRFEIIKRAREHIIDATNIESKPEEMQVLDNFLFRCWQMGWLKNDFHQLEKENEQLKKDKEYLDDTTNEQTEVILKLNEQIEKMKCCGNCKHCCLRGDFYIGMTCSLPNTKIDLGNNCNKWELAE